MAPYAKERHVAELAVLRAALVTKRMQFTVNEISKYDNSPVTIADFAAQALLIKALHDSFPDDKFLGEENAAVLRSDEALSREIYDLVLSAADIADLSTGEAVTLPKPQSVEEMWDLIDLGGCGVGSKSERFWVMDPVDGTAAFLKGQQYAVSLALIENGKEVVGVLGCPNISAEMSQISEANVDTDGLGIMLTAVRSCGATIRTMTPSGLRDAIPLDILTASSLQRLHIVDCAAATTHRHDVIAQLADIFQVEFPCTEVWSSHIRYAALIVGGGDVQFLVPTSPATKMYIWDHAGAQLIFTELGGKVTDLDGKEMDFGAGRDLSKNRGLIAAKRDIHHTMLTEMTRILEEAQG
ncbi:3'(2'), 5'-bisphosphate nucleotidase [Sporothrix schenckii 1099-18]|uniref:3'(2'), 5'-bisphosphate nucleotidase n=1 Tax=Sporothrix schenckii 1099-18 TaxID=1397361 RepID=A0A0F2MEW5_SPOSC|nr:3'(2'), 5'-bisphosphate nucleotidase [Sporothrix schenckii 1099-18]KJR87614.1 3'(2'), 5'-bisphosphate nucleotidase [Sporothrix schenckii 1099-18]